MDSDILLKIIIGILLHSQFAGHDQIAGNLCHERHLNGRNGFLLVGESYTLTFYPILSQHPIDSKQNVFVRILVE